MPVNCSRKCNAQQYDKCDLCYLSESARGRDGYSSGLRVGSHSAASCSRTDGRSCGWCSTLLSEIRHSERSLATKEGL